MKNLYLIVSAVCLFASSCEPSNEEKLIGRWKIGKVNIFCDAPEKCDVYVLGELIRTSADLRRSLEKDAESSGEIYEFYETGKFYRQVEDGAVTGFFKIKRDTLLMTLKNENIVWANPTIEILSANKFRWESKVEFDPNHVHTYTRFYDKVAD